MGAFIDRQPFRVNFPDGEWIDIKPEFSQADLDYITSRMMQTRLVTDSGKPEAQMDMSFGRLATLERGIVAWSFQEDNKPVPVNPENISSLKTRYRSLILTEIDRLNADAAQFSKN